MKIVVVSPHPDDETLGAGGFLLKHRKKGNQLYWINVTDVGENQGWDNSFVKHREKQIHQIYDFYQFEKLYNLKYRPCSLENIDKCNLISDFSKCIQEIQPDCILLPNPQDAHTDHLVTYEVGMTCSKVFRYPYVKKIMTMEIISETNFSKTADAFSPNYFVDISDCIEDKIAALKIYDTELGAPPFPRSIEAVRALALLRGSMAGSHYAEAFKIIKQID